jgi:hypothetical protein
MFGHHATRVVFFVEAFQPLVTDGADQP